MATRPRRPTVLEQVYEERTRAPSADASFAAPVAGFASGPTPGSAGALLRGNNLSDIPSAASARTNLGLGAASTLGVPIPMDKGGTGSSLAAAMGALAYSTTAGLALLAASTATGKLLRSIGSSVPVWSTPAFPNVATVKTFITGNGTDFVNSTAAAAIVQADGTLADITTKFNQLLNNMSSFGFLATT